MRWIYVIAVFCILLGIILSRNYKREGKKAERIIELLYPFARMLIDCMERHDIRRKDDCVTYIRNLWVGEDKKEDYFVKKMAYVIAAMMITAVISFAASYTLSEEHHINGNIITRPGYGEYPLDINITANNEPVSVHIDSVEYTREQTYENFEKAYYDISKAMLQENRSLDCVRQNLKLPTYVEKYDITVDWSSSNYDVIDTTGKINNSGLEEGFTRNAVLTAELRYKEYTADYTWEVTVAAPVRSETEQWIYKVQKSIDRVNAEEPYNSTVQLPERIDGIEVEYEEKTEDYSAVIFALGILFCFVIYFGMDKDLRDKNQERNNQMILDYSEIVSKLTLLLHAGMTVSGAWEKIVWDYEQGKCSNKKRYAYEEMRVACNEMHSGVSESMAYANFARRCNVHEYLKLGALLEQNIKKGTKGMAAVLEAEAIEAFENRKSKAKKAGEEAGTKLLVPMIIMLGIVMVIVMFPALTSFGI